MGCLFFIMWEQEPCLKCSLLLVAAKKEKSLWKKNYRRVLVWVLLGLNFTQIGAAILNNQVYFYCLSVFSFT